MYPNPATNNVQLSIDNGQIEGVWLIHQMGPVNRDDQFVALNTLNLDVSELPASVYHVSVRNSDGIWLHRKLLLQ